LFVYVLTGVQYTILTQLLKNIGALATRLFVI